ncbi:hypothetical protein Btru_046308 [Bulinus truncatus]|nr:hypothetical protein Btru_046308 [Bulinus truncatus]
MGPAYAVLGAQHFTAQLKRKPLKEANRSKMVSSSMSMRLLYNTIIQPLKEMALERYLMAANSKAHSPNRATGRQQSSKDQPLDIILNEQNPGHPARIFSNSAIVQTMAFSGSVEHHGKTYQMGRRQPKMASLPGKATAASKVSKHTGSVPVKRSKSAPSATKGVASRGRGIPRKKKAQQAKPEKTECSSELAISPCMGRASIARTSDKCSSRHREPIEQSFLDRNTNRIGNDVIETNATHTDAPGKSVISLREKICDKWNAFNLHRRTISVLGLPHYCLENAK